MNQFLPLLAFLSLASSIPAQTPEPTYLTGKVNAQLAKVHAANTPASTSKFQPNWNSLAQYRTPDWFRDAKFGIFLHWGVYSVPAFGNEWYSRNMYVPGNEAFKHQLATYGPQTTHGYKDFIPQFRAEHFDPNAWLDLFASAGAKYIVPVAEHCDGFPMYDSALTTWDAARMGPHRDIVGELAQATRNRGLHFGVSSHRAEHWWWYGVGRTFPSDVQDPANAGLYGPAAPMHLPNADGKLPAAEAIKLGDGDHLERWPAPDQPFLDDWLARSTELIDKYHPDFFYFDWWIGQPAFKPGLQQFAAYYYNAGAQHGQQPVLTYKQEDMPANTATLDIERGKLDTLRLLPWQTDTSISIHSWGYVEHDEYRTANSLIAQLVDTVSKNGNLLLNVGPKADGTIAEEARTVLLQIGDWLRINGESIFNTRPFTVFGEGPTQAPKNSTEKDHDIQSYTPQDIRYTTSKDGSTLYATALGWPSGDELTLHTLYAGNPYQPAPICAISLLGGPNIHFQQMPDGLHLTIPATAPVSNPTVTAYVFKILTNPTSCH